MFKEFLANILKKIVSFMKNHEDFFKLSEVDRHEKLNHLQIPKSFKVYLLIAKEKSFIEDIALILKFIKEPKKTAIKGNAFFKCLLRFLTQELAHKIDYLEGSFYLLDKEDRQELVDKLIPSDSNLAQALKNILINNTYQQILAEVHSTAARVGKAPFVLVQTPREVETKLKKEIRQNLSEKYPLSLPIFQINKKLIGGIRIFEDGQTIDHSWLNKVIRFTSITNA